MEPEIEAVIEIEAEQIDSTESESILKPWYSAAQIQGILNLNKAMLQSSIAKLIDIYGIPIGNLRRGNARATEYSELAVSAIEFLNTRKFSELRKLVEESPAIVSTPSSTPCSALAVSPMLAISTLDSKIAELQRTSALNSANLADRVRNKLAEIAQTNQLASDRTQSLNEAQLLAAENEGFEEALEIHARRISSRNAALAQLRAMELENQG
jgi:hypothetical protein